MKTGTITVIIIAAAILVAGVFFFVLNKGTPNTNNQGNIPSTTNSTTHDVFMQNFAFNPGSLTIKTGDIVTWTNMDNVAHTVTSDSGTELHSSTLSPGGSYSHTFTQAGTYTYHCSIHTMMKGTIVVQ